MRAIRTPPWRTTTSEVARARRDADPIRLVWTLFYVAVCHAVLRTPARRSGRCAGGGGGRGDDR